MSSASGRTRVKGAAVSPGGDVRMLEDLLLENLRSNADGRAIEDADLNGKKHGKYSGGSRRGSRR